MSDGRVPAVFIGHGSPMNALEHNRYTEVWQTFGLNVPRPRAILALGAALASLRDRGVLIDGYAMGSLSMTAFTLP